MHIQWDLHDLRLSCASNSSTNMQHIGLQVTSGFEEEGLRGGQAMFFLCTTLAILFLSSQYHGCVKIYDLRPCYLQLQVHMYIARSVEVEHVHDPLFCVWRATLIYNVLYFMVLSRIFMSGWLKNPAWDVLKNLLDYQPGCSTACCSSNLWCYCTPVLGTTMQTILEYNNAQLHSPFQTVPILYVYNYAVHWTKHVQCSPMKSRILGTSLVAMVFVGRFSWILAPSKRIFMSYLPMKQSNPCKNRNHTISRTEGASRTHKISSHACTSRLVSQATCTCQEYILPQGIMNIRKFIDETCTTTISTLKPACMCTSRRLNCTCMYTTMSHIKQCMYVYSYAVLESTCTYAAVQYMGKTFNTQECNLAKY